MSDERMFSAKQVASRIGTDAKQLRKFFRDPNSGYDPVGQGGRYDFPESELAKIAEAFATWSSTKRTRNRTASPQRKLAEGAGVVPRARRSSAPADKPAHRRDMKNGLHGNALDDDTLEDRTELGIKGRVEKHGLMVKQGRLIPSPRPEKTAEEILNPWEGLDRSSIPGLTAPPEDDFIDTPHGELQGLVDYLEDGPGEEIDFDEVEEIDF